jgi:hypothetical protein
MSDSEAVVRIVGDASKVAPAAQQAKSEITGLAEATAASSAKMKESFAGVSIAVHEMGMQVRETFEAIGAFREVLAGIGEAMIAAFAVEKVADWTKEMAEVAEKTAHMAETFGMTVPQVQGLDAAAKLTGMSIDTMSKAMGIFDKNMVTAATGTGHVSDVLKSMGITARDSKSQMELILEVADKFHSMADGPQKVAVAMQLFGRAGKEMIPYLNQGREGITELDRVSREYSAGTMDATNATKELRTWLTEANAKGRELAESTNTTSVAMQGVSNVMTDAFAPVLKQMVDGVNELVKSFIDSYREGGTVAVAFEAISGAAQVLTELISATGEVFSALWQVVSESIGAIGQIIADVFGIHGPKSVSALRVAFNELRDAVVVMKDIIIMALDSVMLVVEQAVGHVNAAASAIWTALRGGSWGEIQAAWHAGLANCEKEVEATTRRVVALSQEMHNALAAAMGGLAPGGTNGVPTPKATKDFNPPLPSAHEKKPKKEPKEKDTIVQDLDAKLEKQKTDYAALQDAQGTYQQWSLQSDADFWSQALQRQDLSAKDRDAIERKYLAARLAVLKEKQAAETEDAKQSAALATESAKLEGELAKMALEDKLSAINEARNAGKISAVEEIREKAAVNQQLLDLEKTNADAIYKIKLAELQAEAAVLGEKPLYYKKIADQITLLAQQHADQEVLINRKKNQTQLTDDQKIAAQQRSIWNQAFQGFSANIGKMVTLQQGFAATFKGIWQSLQDMFAQAISNMIRNFLVGLVTQEVAEKASNQRSVLGTAKVAAANAYKAMVGIPIVGPVLAPIAAGVAFAAVEAFSAEGGMGSVPYDNAPFMLHKNEMVLPASLANPMRDMLQGGFSLPSSVTQPLGQWRSEASLPAAGNMGGPTGDTHNHHYHGPVYLGDINAMDSKSFGQFTMDNKHHIAAAGQKAIRDGWRGAR